MDSIKHGSTQSVTGSHPIGDSVFRAISETSGLDQVSLAKSRMILKYQSQAFQLALKHRIPIAFGLDHDPDFLPNEFSAMVTLG